MLYFVLAIPHKTLFIAGIVEIIDAIKRYDDCAISATEGTEPEILKVMKPMNLHHDILIVIDQNNHDHWFRYFMAKPHSDCEYQRFNNMRHKLVSSK